MDLRTIVPIRVITNLLIVGFGLTICGIVGPSLARARNGHESDISMNKELYDIITKIGSKSINYHEYLENILGIKFKLISENLFRYYEARDVNLAGLPVDLIDYREPPSGNISSSRSYLKINFGKNCVKKEEISLHFGDLRFAGVPSDNNNEEQIYYFKSMPWGVMGFGFSEKRPNCMKTIDFSFK